MAKPSTTTRQAVTATGVSLLALIAAAEAGYLMLTQAEGMEIVNAGHATVDGSITDGDTAAVRLTDAGRSALAASQGGNANGAPAAASFAIDDAVPLPAKSARGRSGGYPFEQLGLNQSFHVGLAAGETAEQVAVRLQSSVSGARARFAEVIPGQSKTVTVREYQRGADGKYVKGADGKRIQTAERQETRPATKLTRDFTVKAVDASDPRGPGARVWRTA